MQVIYACSCVITNDIQGGPSILHRAFVRLERNEADDVIQLADKGIRRKRLLTKLPARHRSGIHHLSRAMGQLPSNTSPVHYPRRLTGTKAVRMVQLRRMFSYSRHLRPP